jgi:hypothetical protein
VRKLLSNCLFPRRRLINKVVSGSVVSGIKTDYKSSFKPEITHNYPSFWIVGSTKNIHKFSLFRAVPRRNTRGLCSQGTKYLDHKPKSKLPYFNNVNRST